MKDILRSFNGAKSPSKVESWQMLKV